MHDEPPALEALALHIRRKYDCSVAQDAPAALNLLERYHPALLVASLPVGGLEGGEFFRAARRMSPHTVTLLLTNQVNAWRLAEAVNETTVYRVIFDPEGPAEVLAASEAAMAEYARLQAERAVAPQMQRACVKSLIDLFALAAPTAHTRAIRVRVHALDLWGSLGEGPSWELGTAAVLSNVGCLTLPGSTVERLYESTPLTPDELAMVERIPEASEQLLAGIPDFMAVRTMVLHQARRFDGGGPPKGSTLAGEELPRGARILKIAIDYASLEAEGLEPGHALDILSGREGAYDASFVERFSACVLRRADRVRVMQEIPVKGLRPGMVLAQDVRNQAGTLLVPRGQPLTGQLVEHIKRFKAGQVREPLRVLVRA